MAKMNLSETAWSQSLICHEDPDKRNDIYQVDGKIRTPFSWSSFSTDGPGWTDLSSLRRRWQDSWVLAPVFANQSWIPLFSNAASARELFKLNSRSPRLETAFLGCDPEEGGWCFQWTRAGKQIIDFECPLDTFPGTRMEFGDIDLQVICGAQTGERVFRRLCAHAEIPLPVRQIQTIKRGFEVLGKNGKPVKTALRGYAYYRAPAP